MAKWRKADTCEPCRNHFKKHLLEEDEELVKTFCRPDEPPHNSKSYNEWVRWQRTTAARNPQEEGN